MELAPAEQTVPRTRVISDFLNVYTYNSVLQRQWPFSYEGEMTINEGSLVSDHREYVKVVHGQNHHP